MRKLRYFPLLVAAVFLLAPSALRGQITPTGMKLLTRNTGWALYGRLYWTNDFGQDWRDITPRQRWGELASVYFLNTSDGWAVLRRWDHGPHFAVVRTDSAGAGWSLPETIPDEWGCLYCSKPGGAATIAFADAYHGWIDVDASANTASSDGYLFATSDGGRTWTYLPRSLGIAARLCFISDSVGWAAGGPDGSDLYITRDGGKSWQKITPLPPLQVGTPVTIETASLKRVLPGGFAVLPTYDLPHFTDPHHGYLPVSYAGWQPGRSREPERLVIFETNNGGSSWRPAKVFTAKGESTAGDRVPSAIADSTAFVPTASTKSQPAVAHASLARGNALFSAAVPTKRGISQLSFIDAERGWARTYWPVARLEATADGGSTWADVTPGRAAKTAKPARAPAPTTAASAAPSAPVSQTLGAAASGGGGGNGAGLHTSIHLGFDKLGVPPATDMSTWWGYGPYYDVGFYVPGARVGDPNVTGTRASTAAGEGWGEIPIWDGLQAPCACKAGGPYPSCTTFFGSTETFSTDPTTAESQGETQGQLAGASELPSIGLSKGSVYLDLEAYNSAYQFGSDTCGQAVTAYVDGFASAVEDYGYTAAVCGSPTDTTDWWNASPRPADAWIGKDDKRATIWGLGYEMPDSGVWGEGYRAHQYDDNVTETYGGVQLSIDRDIEWAQVDGGNTAKTYTYGTTASVQPGNGVLAVNDDGQGEGDPLQAVGFCETGAGEAFLWSADPNAPASLCFEPAGAPMNTAATGINNQGNAQEGPELVGSFDPAANGPEGSTGTATSIAGGGAPTIFQYPGEPFVQLIGINDDDQILGEYYTGIGCPPQGFVYDAASNTYKIVDLGGDRDSYVSAINGFGQVTGGGVIGGKFVDFVWDWARGTFTYTYSVHAECGSGSGSYQGALRGDQQQRDLLALLQGHVKRNQLEHTLRLLARFHRRAGPDHGRDQRRRRPRGRVRGNLRPTALTCSVGDAGSHPRDKP